MGEYGVMCPCEYCKKVRAAEQGQDDFMWICSFGGKHTASDSCDCDPYRGADSFTQPPAGDAVSDGLRELAAKYTTGESVERCKCCGDDACTWFTDNDLWNKVDETGILCMTCFINKAEARGLVTTGWKLIPEERAAVAREGMVPRDSMKDLLSERDEEWRGKTAGMVSLDDVAKAIKYAMTESLLVLWCGDREAYIASLVSVVRNRLAKPAEQMDEQKVEAILAKSQGDICTKEMRESVAAEIVAALRNGKEGK